MLEPQERIALTDIIAGLYDFTDGGARGRRVLITQANLSGFLPGIDLTGPPNTVAGDLLSRIEDFGPLPERSTYHTLGALLSYVITRKDLAKDSARKLAELIVRYSLVADPAYISKLREDYQIAEAPVRQPDPQHAAPPLAAVTVKAPDFTVVPTDEQGLERVINSEDNFLDINLLAGAIYSAQAVCRVELPLGKPIGTGFLIGPDLVLTNFHVLRGLEDVRDAVVRFDFKSDPAQVSTPGHIFKLQADFYNSSDASDLDYALVRLESEPLKSMALDGPVGTLSLQDLVFKGKHRGYLVLVPSFIRAEERVNIIQHPNGDPLRVVMTQNRVVADMTDRRVQYVADTMEGSSGSPVFNQNWEVVGLHHSGKPYPPEAALEAARKIWKGHFRFNEGIPMRAILKDFDEKGIMDLLPRS